jgi:hypothetical protein
MCWYIWRIWNTVLILQNIQTPVQHHPRLASVKGCEDNFPTIRYFDLPQPFVYRHKLRWTNSTAVSGCDCTLFSYCTVMFSVTNSFFTIKVSKLVYFDGIRFCQIIFIVYENPHSDIAWIINSNFSVISYELYTIVSTADKAALYVRNFQHAK